MTTNENFANIFPVLNTADLSGEYRLFEIEGLDISSTDYQRNKQYLISSLSRNLKHPVEVIQRNQKAYIVTRNEETILALLPEEFPAIGNNILYFRDTGEVFPLDFNSTNPSKRAICKRFLQFSIQGVLFKNKRLWQPAAGKPFFSKKAIPRNDISIYPGFSVRVVDLKSDGWGITIDATRKYLKTKPLPIHLPKEEFDRKYKGRKVVVRLGQQWYEIKLTQWHSLPVSQHKYPNPNGEGNITLLEDLRQRIPKPHPQLLAQLPADGSVVFYHLANGEARSVPAGLCFLVMGTEDEMDGHLHQNSILSPDMRLSEIFEISEKLLSQLTFGEKKIRLGNQLKTIPKKKFNFPDIVLGDNEKFTFQAAKNNPNLFASVRSKKIFSGNPGFLKPLQPLFGPQYIFLPRSIFDTCKEDFIRRIMEEVNTMYPWSSYNPKVEHFEDIPSKRADYVAMGRRILSEIQEKVSDKIHSYALIMIPQVIKGKRQHDKLSALLIKELKKVNISATIIHSNTVEASYEEKLSSAGEVSYSVYAQMRGKLKGYCRNVALAKILLNNRKYPFALATGLHADLTIGIDVKNNLAGFVFVDKFARNIRAEFEPVTKKEKLPTRVLVKMLYETIKNEAQHGLLRHIVVQRDGRIFDTELRAVDIVLKKLIEEQVLPAGASISVVEIPKSSFLSFRIFSNYELFTGNNANELNPEIGSYYLLNNETAYVCTTGKEFHHKGTSKPLLVKYISGGLPFEAVLEDVFFLSTLAFTKPDDCSRLPLTIKILDLFLRDKASEYDEDKLDYLEYSTSDEFEIIKPEINLN